MYTVALYTGRIQGGRQYQEDEYANVKISDNTYFCGIFDGHGGGSISKMCAERFPEVIKQGMVEMPYDLAKTVHMSFYIMDKIALEQYNSQHVGSTVVFCLMHPDAIWFANAGDSMSMIGLVDGSCMVMSQEHKVELEKERIIADGGFITNFDGTSRVNGNLNVSRGIGDGELKRWVTCNPYVRSISNNLDSIKYIFMGSDGVWDVLSAEALNEIIKTSFLSLDKTENYMTEIVNRIIETAYSMGSTDNITATLIEITKAA